MKPWESDRYIDIMVQRDFDKEQRDTDRNTETLIEDSYRTTQASRVAFSIPLALVLAATYQVCRCFLGT